MQLKKVFTISFETEKNLAIHTRINSLLFRKSLYPLSWKMDYKYKHDCYIVKLNIESDNLSINVLSRQIDRLVGVSNVNVELSEG